MNKKTMNLLEKAISQEKGVETEAVYFGTKSALTRFTLNRIHQNMARDDAEIQIRVIIDGREGTFTTNQLTSDGLHQAFHAARKIALSGPRCENFPGLPRGRKSIEFENISPATLRCTPAKRAELVKKIIKAAKKAGTEAAGALSTRTSTLAVANSSGIRSYQKTTMAELNFVPSRGELSGYAYWAGADIDELPLAALAKEAVVAAAFPKKPVSLTPGAYRVVLSPYAAGNLLKLLALIGFGAKSYLEKRSFMVKKRGKPVASEMITIYDDGRDPAGLPSSFDYEGVLKKKVYFIRKGIAADLVHDSKTAARAGVRNTGHALPSPNVFGPFPGNLFVSPGKTPQGQLLKGIRRGIYITRFHYVNIVEPIETVMTGMTRDGTFLIENGEIAAPVRNLRFTQNILEALKRVEAVGRERRILSGNSGTIFSPAMRIGKFQFTGVSEY